MEDKYIFSIYRLSAAPDTVIQHLTDRGLVEVPTREESAKLFVGTSESRVPGALRCLSNLVKDPAWMPPQETQVHVVALFSTGSSWYAVASGRIVSSMHHYVSPTFGLDLICRISSSEDIAASDSSIFTGPVTHESRTYRGRRSPAWEFSNVSKLFRRLVAKVPAEGVKSDLGLTNLRGKRVRISGGTAVRVHRKTSLSELKLILSRIDEILLRPPKFTPLMGATAVRSKPLRKELHAALLNQISLWVKNAAAGTLDADDLPVLSHEDPIFSLADSYTIVCRRNTQSCEDVDFAQVLDFIVQQEEEDLERLIQRLKIQYSVDAESFEVPLLKCLQAEVYHQGDWYFLLHGDWYKLSSEFASSIDGYVQQFFEPTPYAVPHSAGDSEDLYVTRMEQLPGAVRFHKRPVVGKLELCDILRFSPGDPEPCLVFIKRGTGQAVRALVAQASESVTRVYQDPVFTKAALQKVRAHCPSAEAPLRSRHFSVHLLILSDRPCNGRQPHLHDLSNVARLNLALGIQSLLGIGVRSVKVSLVV